MNIYTLSSVVLLRKRRIVVPPSLAQANVTVQALGKVYYVNAQGESKGREPSAVTAPEDRSRAEGAGRAKRGAAAGKGKYAKRYSDLIVNQMTLVIKGSSPLFLTPLGIIA